LPGASKAKAGKTASPHCGRDLATRELFATYLESEGYAIVAVASGTAAIEEARRLVPDLIVTDVLMPGPGWSSNLVYTEEHAGNVRNTHHCRLGNES
jgi:DNA-binding NarL/FixJ family response regulator